MKVDVNTVIDAPVEKVWEFMSDLGSATLRDPSVVKVDWQPPAGIGTVAMITHRFLGKRTARYEIKEWEPNRKFRAQVTSMGAKLEGTYTMEPVHGGKTNLNVSVKVEIGGLMRLFSPYISRKARKDASEEIARIKNILEARK
jgi:carbon monoxide dehydrogenase subunit G